MKYNTSPFQFWQLDKDYFYKLSKDEQEFISKFENEFYNGNFKDYKKVKSVFNNSESFKKEYVQNLLSDDEEWIKFKDKFIKQNKYNNLYDFSLQYFKRKCWNRKHKERDDVYAQQIGDFEHYSYEQAHLDHVNKSNIKKNKLNALPEDSLENIEDYYNELQIGLISAIKNNNVLDFVYNYVYFCADSLGNKKIKDAIFNIYELHLNKKLSKYKTFTFIKIFNNLILELTEDDYVTKICQQINLIYDNYIYNKDNIYIRDLLKNHIY